MVSYSKQMMAVAEQWMEENPDPGDAMLKIPGVSRRRNAMAASDAESLIFNARVLAERPDLHPVIAPHLERVDRYMAERNKIASELQDAEAKLEQMINERIRPSHHKHTVDDNLHSDIGRWCLAWGRHGYNVLDLSVDFVAAMLLTDARELDIDSIRMPFAGVMMTIPNGFARGAEGYSYTKIHVAELPSSEMNQLEVSDELIGALESLPRSSQIRVVNKIEREIAQSGGVLPPTSLLGPPVTCHVCEPDEGTALHIYATDGEHALDTFINRRGLTWEALDALPDSVVDDADRQASHEIRRIVFGTLAYLSAVPTSMERRETHRKKRKHRDADGREPTTWEVGRTIRIDPHLVRAARSGHREVALRLKFRHIVRGHYRNQPHGPGRSERKRIWIAPFWQGPKDGAELVHTYKLDSHGDAT